MIDKIISKKVLRKQYEVENIPVREMAKMYGISLTALYKLFDEADIPRKVNKQLKINRVNPILVD